MKINLDIFESVCEEELEKLQLTKECIQKQNSFDLNNSLRLIDKFINNPDFFITIFNGTITDCQYVSHFLLERKKIILNTIQKVSSCEKISTLQELVSQLSESDIKDKLRNDLNLLLVESDKYRKDAQQTEAQIKLEQQRIDGLERKSKIWLSFLQRESAASIIGGLVLLMLTLALIGGMIFGRESQILSNGFLVILGYFFGQSSVKNNKDGGSDSM